MAALNPDALRVETTLLPTLQPLPMPITDAHHAAHL
jgi:hypothetical protein